MRGKKKPKDQPDDKPLRIGGMTLRTIRDLDSVDFDLETEVLREALFATPPLLWADEDDERQIFGVLKALDLGLTAAEAGHVYEIPILDPSKDGGKAMAKCREWLNQKFNLPFRQFALLTRAGPPGIDTRTLLIGVDNDGDGEGFRFAAARAFRAPGGEIGWLSMLSVLVTREEDSAGYTALGGTDTAYAGTYLGVFFHALALVDDGDIAAKHLFDAKKLN